MPHRRCAGGARALRGLASVVPERRAGIFASAAERGRGPLIAIVSFVCSIGNVPLAAVLWASGISFGGVLAFLYADLIVLPLLDIYRRYYGWRMALYIGLIFFVTMVLSGILMDLVFSALHLVPAASPHLASDVDTFKINYTFWLNVLLGGLAAYLFLVNAKHPMHESHCGHHAA
ncbi:MAG: hypothetical protein DLM53_12385 [Candidatus Eremiobacter antarcticus]|nr:MAG: hypothetical protein DLM53_12385 [Candidatus Eremiobacter sp. RRmetagenome_bin22]